MKRIVIFLCVLAGVACAHAQRRQKAVAAPKRVVTVSPGLKLFKQMLPATAKVMFIDSVVVDKSDFLARVPLNSESGTIKTVDASADFANQMASYQNELGLRRIYAFGDSAKSELRTQTMLGDKWSKGTTVADFSQDEYPLQNYPFLASDGVTLYFSAEGDQSMGGRDIFMSSFDSDEASWYKPQNLGLPFNSTANDYLLAIDDLDSLGWLVTDRRQPEGKVCIYTFVPTQTRQNFDDDDLDDDEIMPFARIISISDTWQFGNRDAALKRRDSMLQRAGKKQQRGNAMLFVVNDNTVYTSPSQFKSNDSRQLYQQIVEIRQMADGVEKKLGEARKKYHDGNHDIAGTILKLEGQLEQQNADILNLEKQIRIIENGQ